MTTGNECTRAAPKFPALALGGAEEIIAPEPNSRQPGHDESRIEHPFVVQWREGRDFEPTVALLLSQIWPGVALRTIEKNCPPHQTGPLPVLVLAVQ